MNRIITALIAFAGFVQISFAQPQLKDSTEVYNYWSHRGIIEVTYAYMQDYIETVGEGKSLEEIEGAKKYKEKFIQDIELKATLPSFKEVSDSLKKNSWKRNGKKIFNSLKSNFDNNKKLDKNFFYYQTSDNKKTNITEIPGYENKKEHWDEKIDEIIKNYNDALGKIKSNNQTHSVVAQNSFSPATSYEQTSFFTRVFIKIILIFIISITFFLLGGLAVYFYIKKKITNILSVNNNNDLYLHVEKRKVFFKSIIVMVSKLRKQIIENNEEFLEKESKIKKLAEKNKKLLEENIELGKKNEEYRKFEKGKSKIRDVSIPDDLSIKKQTSKQIIKYFFSIPEENGSFKVVNGNSTNDETKYYRIDYEESSTKGELFYLSSDRDKRAINRLEAYLKPVCEIENIANATNTNKIEVIKSGKVNLSNDSWIIDPENKIKIKLC